LLLRKRGPDYDGFASPQPLKYHYRSRRNQIMRVTIQYCVS